MAGQQNYSHNRAEGNSHNHYGNVYNFGGSPAATPVPAPTTSQNSNVPPNTASHARPTSLNDFRIAIICALESEYEAVYELLEEKWWGEEAFRPLKPDNNTYTFGRLGGKPVALVNLPHMGKIPAAVVASHVKISLRNIEIAFLVGICAGAPYDGEGDSNEGLGNATNIQMADVIIGKQVIEGDYGRLRDDGFERKTGVEDVLGRLPDRITSWLKQRMTWQLRDELREGTESLLSETFKKPKTAKYFAFPGRTGDESFPASRELQIFCGRIVSLSYTLKSQADRDNMIKKDKALGFEMESAGMWDELPTLVVKAVCDYGDNQKTKEWQKFAALTAAACTKVLIGDWVSHAEDPASGGTRIRTSLPLTEPGVAVALQHSNERQESRDKVLSAEHAEPASTRPHESFRQEAGEVDARNDRFWSLVSLAWIYALVNLLLGQSSNTLATNTAKSCEVKFDEYRVCDEIEDAIARVRKVGAIFGHAERSLDDTRNICSKLYVELFNATDLLYKDMLRSEESGDPMLLQEVELVLTAVERVVQDQRHKSHHKYPKLQGLAQTKQQSRAYETEKTRILSHLQDLLKTRGAALEDLQHQVFAFTKRRSPPSNAETTIQSKRAKPAGYPSVVKKAVHRILNQSLRCTCSHNTSQGSSHLLQILLEPIAAASPSTTPQVELLISSRPIDHTRLLGQEKGKIPGHWKDVFITYSLVKPGASKQIRWIDQSDGPKSQPDFTLEIKQNDQALCGIISRDPKHRWGFQITGDQLFRASKPSELFKKVQPYHGVPLGSILGLLTDEARACLAYTLAQSLWQFYDCDLTSIKWTCDSIELMWYSGDFKAGEPGLFSTPYLAYRSTTHDAYIKECLHRGTECEVIHGYPRVVALGILLLEIGMGKRFEVPESCIEDPISGPTKDEVWDYAQEQANCPWPNLNYPNYWRSVKNCFDVHLFDDAPPQPEATAQAEERELSKRRDILYDQVVQPLEPLVYGTGWANGLGSKTHVSLPSCSSEANQVASSTNILVAVQ